MSDEKPMGQVIQIDEARIRDHLGEMVRGTVEETILLANAEPSTHGTSLQDSIRYRSRLKDQGNEPSSRFASSSVAVLATGGD
jgi:hypothetical protein